VTTLHEFVAEALKDYPRPLNDLELLVQTCLLDTIASISGDQAARGAIGMCALLRARPENVDITSVLSKTKELPGGSG
jgi:hypothetical protein